MRESKAEIAYKAKMRRIEIKGRKKLRKRALIKARMKYWPKLPKLPKINPPNQSKMGMWYIFISCTAVQVYSMVAMWHFADLSALYSLIGATVGESIAYYSYTAKSKAENTSGGITFENAMRTFDEANQEEAKG